MKVFPPTVTYLRTGVGLGTFGAIRSMCTNVFCRLLFGDELHDLNNRVDLSCFLDFIAYLGYPLEERTNPGKLKPALYLGVK